MCLANHRQNPKKQEKERTFTMGKGKRNRQYHFEDRQANPTKYKEKKKQFRMPKWAKYTIAAVLALAIIVPIVITSLISGGTFLRARVLVDSKSGQFDLNQQMATFILWQNMYQSAYYEWYYASWGLQEDTNNITKNYKSAAAYGIDVASTYTNMYLRDGIEEIADYLTELVAGADAGVAAGLTLNADDDKAIAEFTTWMQNVYAASEFAGYTTYENFLTTTVGQGINASDIESAARLLTMYTKYCNYAKLDLDDDPTESILQEFIEKNPSGHYEIKYHQYTNASEDFLKKLYEKLGKEYKSEADKKNDKNAEEVLLSMDVAEFRKLVIETILEEGFKNAVLNKYAVNGDAGEALDALNVKNLTAEKRAEKLAELGIEKTAFDSKKNTDLNKDISSWIFDTKRKVNDTTLITSGESTYLVYIFTQPTTDKDTKAIKVEAGWKEYKFANYESKVEGFYEMLKEDLINAEKSEQSKVHLSAEEIAKQFYDDLKNNKKTWSDIKAEDIKKEDLTKPKDDDKDTTAIEDKLYAAGTKVNEGDIFQADDNGTSYVIKVTKVSGTNYSVEYTTFKDSDYHGFYRSFTSSLDASYNKEAATLTHPESTTKGSLNEWLCAGKYDETKKDRVFDRVKNDVAHFAATDSNGKNTGKFNVCVVSTPMQQVKKDEATVYGGYLQFKTEQEAKDALALVSGKTGFDLWHAFSALSVTTTTGTGSDAKTTTTDATVETALTKEDVTDAKLEEWFFSKDRKANDTAVVKGASGYYVAFFKSTEQTWTRTAKDSWVSTQMTEKLLGLIKDGGYEIPEATLNKIGESKLETTTPAKS